MSALNSFKIMANNFSGSIGFLLELTHEYATARSISGDDALRPGHRGGVDGAHLATERQQIACRSFERSAGFPLLARVGRGLTPTVDGKKFFKGVEGMFVGIDRLEDLARSIRTSQGGTISTSTIQSMALIELPIAVGQMYRDKPQVRFNASSRNTPAILDAVQMHQVDLGIVGRDANHEGVETLFQTSALTSACFPKTIRWPIRWGPLILNR